MSDGRELVGTIEVGNEEARSVRGRRQYQFEMNELDGLKGEPFMERYIRIRQAVFEQFGNVRGERPAVLSRSVELKDYFPSSEVVASELIPGLNRLVDRLEDRVNQEKDEVRRAEQGERLAALIYFMFISIHPASDGNAQTSYLHEFSPDSENRFFPIKYGVVFEESGMRNLFIPTPEGVYKEWNLGLPEVMTNADEKTRNRASEFKHKVRAIEDSSVGFEEQENRLRSLFTEYSDLVGEYQRDERIKRNPGAVVGNIMEKLSDTLESKYPGYTFWNRDVFRQRERMLRFFLVGQDGRKILEDYITNGVSVRGDLEGRKSESIGRVVRELERLNNAFGDEMESRSVHEQKFQLNDGVGS